MNLLYSTKEFKFPSNQKVTGQFPIVEDIEIPKNIERVITVQYKICKRQEGASIINIGDAISRFQVSVTQCHNVEITGILSHTILAKISWKQLIY